MSTHPAKAYKGKQTLYDQFSSTDRSDVLEAFKDYCRLMLGTNTLGSHAINSHADAIMDSGGKKQAQFSIYLSNKGSFTHSIITVNPTTKPIDALTVDDMARVLVATYRNGVAGAAVFGAIRRTGSHLAYQ